MAERAGTRFRALLQSTSWKVTPLNSGGRVLRTKPAIFESPGSASGSSDLTVWPSQRMGSLEHSFESGASVRRVRPSPADRQSGRELGGAGQDGQVRRQQR